MKCPCIVRPNIVDIGGRGNDMMFEKDFTSGHISLNKFDFMMGKLNTVR